MQIEKNVPMPDRIANRIRLGHIPLGELNSGNSILIECTDAEKDRIIHSVRVRLGRFSIRNPEFKFSSTKVPEGIRIWRK